MSLLKFENTRAGGTRESIARDFRQGRADAVADVQERVQRIVGYRGYWIPHHEQQELVQEILLQIWQGVQKEGFDPDQGFWGFVQVVTTRKCIDWMRLKRMQSLEDTQPASAPDSDPLQHYLDDERQEVAARVVTRLGDGCLELIRHRITDQLSYAEIAKETKRSEQALRAQFYRCMRKARVMIEEHEDVTHEAQ